LAGKITRQKVATKSATVAKSVQLKPLAADKSLANSYENSRFSWAACSDIKNGTIEQLTSVAGCREGFINLYKYLVENGDKKLCKRKTSLMVWLNKGGQRSPTNPVDGKGARLDVTYEVWMEKCMLTGLLLLNHFEKRSKWLNTKMYKVDHKLNDQIIYYFNGSRWWQFAPHSISLFCLLIRLGKFPALQSLRRNASNDTIIKALTSLGGSTIDADYARGAGKWQVFLDNRREIYQGREFEDNWKLADGGREGIRRLTGREANDATIQRRFNEFLKKK
jgi:hypothetical protein